MNKTRIPMRPRAVPPRGLTPDADGRRQRYYSLADRSNRMVPDYISGAGVSSQYRHHLLAAMMHYCDFTSLDFAEDMREARRLYLKHTEGKGEQHLRVCTLLDDEPVGDVTTVTSSETITSPPPLPVSESLAPPLNDLIEPGSDLARSIVSLHNAGNTVSSITNRLVSEYYINETDVRNVLTQAGLRPVDVATPPVNDADQHIAASFDSGNTIQYIAALWNQSESAIRSSLDRSGRLTLQSAPAPSNRPRGRTLEYTEFLAAYSLFRRDRQNSNSLSEAVLRERYTAYTRGQRDTFDRWLQRQRTETGAWV
jgi:hypothetical protein